MQQAFSNGKIPDDVDGSDETTQVHRKSLPTPPRPPLTWSQYLRVPDGPLAHLGRVKLEKVNCREVKGVVAMVVLLLKNFKKLIDFQSDEFPLSLDHLLDILQVLEPVNLTVNKLRNFCSSERLPSGFPIRLGLLFFNTLIVRINT